MFRLKNTPPPLGLGAHIRLAIHLYKRRPGIRQIESARERDSTRMRKKRRERVCVRARAREREREKKRKGAREGDSESGRKREGEKERKRESARARGSLGGISVNGNFLMGALFLDQCNTDNMGRLSTRGSLR